MSTKDVKVFVQINANYTRSRTCCTCLKNLLIFLLCLDIVVIDVLDESTDVADSLDPLDDSYS